MQDADSLTVINNREDLCFWQGYNRIYRDTDLNDDPYFGVQISCNYHNLTSLSETVNEPIFLSVNIQSLLSKHERLVQLLLELNSANIIVDAIAVQEIWDVRYPELVDIPGFKQLLYKKRADMRGGGVGFYIREGLNANIVENLSPFENKIFESITVQLSYPSSSRKVLLTSAYRSNGVIPNITQAQQMDLFFESFGDLVLNLQETKKESFIFMDANINLLNLDCADSQNYMNLLFATGYLQCVHKATRIQNDSKTLIDHIHCNSLSNIISAGVLISDISDHFFTFVGSQSANPNPNKSKTVVSRDFSATNINNFKRELGLADWNNVMLSNDVDSAFDCFWSTYSTMYKQAFPLKRKRFNKNFNGINKFMTAGLLVSRRTKDKLHLLAVSDPLPMNINKYKAYKSVYQRTIRAAKKLQI